MTERSYNYPAKNEVRRAWMDFLPPTLLQPTDMGLYMPGPENLEFSGYVRKHVSASRLIGIEHDEKRFRRAQPNMSGIWFLHGSIRRAVELWQEQQFPRLRFANLDFDGTLHTFLEDLFELGRIFPSVQESYLSITSYAARDRGARIQGIVNSCKFYSGLSSVSLFVTSYGRMLARYDHLLRLIPRHEATSHSHFQRELELLWWIVLLCAVIEPVVGEGRSVFDSRFIAQLDELTRHLTTEVSAEVEKFPDLDRIVFIANRELREVLKKRRVSWWIQDMQRFAYWSSHRQPMRTWNVHFVPVEEDQEETAQSLLEHVWQLACHCPLVYVDPAGDRVTIG